jgi:hypothetical protein
VTELRTAHRTHCVTTTVQSRTEFALRTVSLAHSEQSRAELLLSYLTSALCLRATDRSSSTSVTTVICSLSILPFFASLSLSVSLPIRPAGSLVTWSFTQSPLSKAGGFILCVYAPGFSSHARNASRADFQHTHSNWRDEQLDCSGMRE